jgi:hypothetical protein
MAIGVFRDHNSVRNPLPVFVRDPNISTVNDEGRACEFKSRINIWMRVRKSVRLAIPRPRDKIWHLLPHIGVASIEVIAGILAPVGIDLKILTMASAACDGWYFAQTQLVSLG